MIGQRSPGGAGPSSAAAAAPTAARRRAMLPSMEDSGSGAETNEGDRPVDSAAAGPPSQGPPSESRIAPVASSDPESIRPSSMPAMTHAPSFGPRFSAASVPPSQRLATVLARVRNPLWSLAALVIVVAGLKEGKAVFVPVALAALLAIIVSPGVRWLERRRVPKVAAVLAVVLGMAMGFAAIGAMVAGSVAGFRESSAEYSNKLIAMLAGASAWLQSKGVPADLDTAIKNVDAGAAVRKGADMVLNSLEGVLAALSNTLFVAITMILILIEGNTVPSKLRALSDDPNADISYFRHIASQVQSYLAIKTVLSLGTGVAVGVWAVVLDVDFALLWGLLAFLLNYIPNIGSILAAVPAMLLALIQHGPGTSLGLGAGYVVVNMLVGNVVEPMWMGRKLGLSTTVVFVSLVVWYEMWGPIGMLLSVPLTMIIKIMLEHSRDYAFIAALLDSGEAPEEALAVGDIASGESESPE